MESLEEAVDAAIEDLPSGSVIKPFLTAHRSEVKRMCITEYDEERTLAEIRKEGHDEGRAEGRAEGILETLIGLVKDGILSLSDAAKRAHMSISEFESKTGLSG